MKLKRILHINGQKINKLIFVYKGKVIEDNNLLNSSELNKSFIQFENNSKNELFFGLNLPKLESNSPNLFSSQILSTSSNDSTKEDSIKISNSYKSIRTSLNKKLKKFSLYKKENIRKDIYGNIIKKGGKHKVSFKDNLKGKKLVEMTLIDVKQSSIRGKNYKKYTISLEAKDKRDAFASSNCNIF